MKTVDDLPRMGATRAVREYLQGLDDAAPDLVGTKRLKPAAISLTDPGSALSTKYGKRRFAYGLNAMIDTASDVVLDVEAAPARTADEPEAARRMVERMRGRRGIVPDMLTADTGYGSGHFLAWAEEAGVTAMVPLSASSAGTGRLTPKSAFVYDAETDSYTCPAGKTLLRGGMRGKVKADRITDTVSYCASRRDCGPCPDRESCAPSGVRTLSRSIHEPARERAAARAQTRIYRKAQAVRLRVERLFAHIKHNDGLHRVRLRGLRGAAEQFALAAAARNLKLLAKKLIPQTAPRSCTA